MVKISSIKTYTKPNNYQKIDKYLSRSAQPTKENIIWLKEQGVTDIINLRTMKVADLNFNEEKFVKKNGMNYHHIPSITRYPAIENVGKFLDIVDSVKQKGGFAHVHCKAGADRTGMYVYIYERLNNIGTIEKSIQELINHSWHQDRYPNLDKWAEKFVKMFK